MRRAVMAVALVRAAATLLVAMQRSARRPVTQVAEIEKAEVE
jgi:hypothetical protein